MIPEPEVRHATERAKGLCEACKVGAGMIVRRHDGGFWVRFSTASGRWFDARGVRYNPCDLVGREEIVKLEVVRAPERNPRTLISGRIVALCQTCRASTCAGDEAPARPENMELDL